MPLDGKHCLEQQKRAILWSKAIIVTWPVSGRTLMEFDSNNLAMNFPTLNVSLYTIYWNNYK
jgi:hypothetical protein